MRSLPLPPSRSRSRHFRRLSPLLSLLPLSALLPAVAQTQTPDPIRPTVTATAQTTAASAASNKRCNGEPMPEVAAQYPLECAIDLGVLPDTGTDVAPQLEAALASLVSTERGLFLPKGTYIVNRTLTLRTGNSLVGSPSGTTRLLNRSGRTTELQQTLAHSGTRTLVEGLVLDDIALNFFHHGNAIRYNAFVNTREPSAQLAAFGSDYEIRGNVLLRGQAQPGVGIDSSYLRDGQVIGNVLGASQTQRPRVGGFVDERTLAVLDRALQVQTGTDGGLGAFTDALRGTNVNNLSFRRNYVSLSRLTTSKDGSPEQTAIRLKRPLKLAIADNYLGLEATDGEAATVRLAAPQGAVINGNSLDWMDVMITPDVGKPDRPTKQTALINNLIWGGRLVMTQPVTGTTPDSTTRDDLVVVGNRLRPRADGACPLAAPAAAAGTSFRHADNLSFQGQRVSTCALDEEPASDALARMHPELRAAAAQKRLLVNGRGKLETEDFSLDDRLGLAGIRAPVAFVVAPQPGIDDARMQTLNAGASGVTRLPVALEDLKHRLFSASAMLGAYRYNGCKWEPVSLNSTCGSLLTSVYGMDVQQAFPRPAGDYRAYIRVQPKTITAPFTDLEDITLTYYEARP